MFIQAVPSVGVKADTSPTVCCYWIILTQKPSPLSLEFPAAANASENAQHVGPRQQSRSWSQSLVMQHAEERTTCVILKTIAPPTEQLG